MKKYLFLYKWRILLYLLVYILFAGANSLIAIITELVFSGRLPLNQTNSVVFFCLGFPLCVILIMLFRYLKNKIKIWNQGSITSKMREDFAEKEGFLNGEKIALIQKYYDHTLSCKVELVGAVLSCLVYFAVSLTMNVILAGVLMGVGIGSVGLFQIFARSSEKEKKILSDRQNLAEEELSLTTDTDFLKKNANFEKAQRLVWEREEKYRLVEALSLLIVNAAIFTVGVLLLHFEMTVLSKFGGIITITEISFLAIKDIFEQIKKSKEFPKTSDFH